MSKDLTLGILYSGQLETQLIKSAKKIGGIKTVVLTNDNDGPAKHVADEFICADLNDTPLSFTYRIIAKNNFDTFKECGKGIAKSYVKIPFTRIDYILHDNKFKTKSYFLDNNEYSDHYPIITKIDFLE